MYTGFVWLGQLGDQQIQALWDQPLIYEIEKGRTKSQMMLANSWVRTKAGIK